MPSSRRGRSVSSISFLRIVSAMFMRVHARCAHDVRPPHHDELGGRCHLGPGKLSRITK
jgi:hypothetical protein